MPGIVQPGLRWLLPRRSGLRHLPRQQLLRRRLLRREWQHLQCGVRDALHDRPVLAATAALAAAAIAAALAAAALAAAAHAAAAVAAALAAAAVAAALAAAAIATQLRRL